MHIGLHLASAVPFALAGAWGGVVGCLLPDVPLLVMEGFSAMFLQEKLDRAGRSLPVITAYRMTHSVLCWGVAALAVSDWWVFTGAVIHILLDVPFHGGRFSTHLLFPLWRMGCAKCVVALSGGYDSVASLVLALGWYGDGNVNGCFFDYGQPYLAQERAAISYIRQIAGIEVAEVPLIPIPAIAGSSMFPERNFTFVRNLGRRFPGRDIIVGVRNPSILFDRYGDANWWSLFCYAKHRSLSIRTPVILYPKWLVRRTVVAGGYDLGRLFSSAQYPSS